MPNLAEIRRAVIGKINLSPADEVRMGYVRDLNAFTGRDTVIYASKFSVPSPNVPGEIIAINDEDVQHFMTVLSNLSGKELDIVLHSPGGSINSADQIVQYLRRKYDHIRVIVPQNAMSAATMIACAADEIIMGRHSALGPTNPIIAVPGQFSVPAQSILNEFDRARREVSQNPKVIPIWISRIANWPPGLLTECEKAIELATEKVAEWLGSYMLEGKRNKAKEIAGYLSNASLHKTHGRPLGIDVLRAKGLKIIALEDDQGLQERVLSAFHAATVTFEITTCVKIVENHIGRGVFNQIAPPLPPQMLMGQVPASLKDALPAP